MPSSTMRSTRASMCGRVPRAAGPWRCVPGACRCGRWACCAARCRAYPLTRQISKARITRCGLARSMRLPVAGSNRSSSSSRCQDPLRFRSALEMLARIASSRTGNGSRPLHSASMYSPLPPTSTAKPLALSNACSTGSASRANCPALQVSVNVQLPDEVVLHIQPFPLPMDAPSRSAWPNRTAVSPH